jgi:hypothetical protein
MKAIIHILTNCDVKTNPLLTFQLLSRVLEMQGYCLDGRVQFLRFFSTPHHPDQLGAYPAICTAGIGSSFSSVRWQVYGTDHSPQSSPKVKDGRALAPPPYTSSNGYIFHLLPEIRNTAVLYFGV